MALQVEVGSDLFEVRGNDGPEIFERFFVQVVTPKGRRFRHEFSFPAVELAHDPEEGPYYRRVWDAADKAEAFASRVRARLDAGGKLNMDHWGEAAPVYGSEAYVDFEAAEIVPALAFIRDGGSLDDVSPSIRAYL